MKFNSLNDISNYLESIYEGDIVIDQTELANQRLEGAINGKIFRISYSKNLFLMLSTNETTSELIEELIPHLSVVMGNTPPICRYSIFTQSMSLISEAKPTVEWDVIEPKKRLKMLVNGLAYNGSNKCLNLQIFENGEFTTDTKKYEDSNFEKANGKKYGLHIGSIGSFNDEYFKNPIKLFLTIEYLNSKIIENNEIGSKNGIIIDNTENEHALDFCIYQTKRFGVELPLPTSKKRMEKTESYIKWHDFYVDHFKNFSIEQWDDFKKRLSSNSDISKYMPLDDWNTSDKGLKKILH